MSEAEQETTGATPPCPKCAGEMWDNRVGKRNPKAPDFKCKDRSCDGVVWPPRDSARAAEPAQAPTGVGGGLSADGMPLCPICGGAMWDDRTSKRNPRAPDFKCRNKPRERGGPGCEGVIWPSRDGSPSPYPAGPDRGASRAAAPAPSYGREPGMGERPPMYEAPPHDDDDLPF